MILVVERLPRLLYAGRPGGPRPAADRAPMMLCTFGKGKERISLGRRSESGVLVVVRKPRPGARIPFLRFLQPSHLSVRHGSVSAEDWLDFVGATPRNGGVQTGTAGVSHGLENDAGGWPTRRNGRKSSGVASRRRRKHTPASRCIGLIHPAQLRSPVGRVTFEPRIARSRSRHWPDSDPRAGSNG